MAAARFEFEINRVCDCKCERKVNITNPVCVVSLLFHSLNRSFRRNQSSQAQTAETDQFRQAILRRVFHIYHVIIPVVDFFIECILYHWLSEKIFVDKGARYI